MGERERQRRKEGGREGEMGMEKRDGNRETHKDREGDREQAERTRQSQGKQVTLLDLRSHEIFMDL